MKYWIKGTETDIVWGFVDLAWWLSLVTNCSGSLYLKLKFLFSVLFQSTLLSLGFPKDPL